jgi:hypothetical protein
MTLPAFLDDLRIQTYRIQKALSGPRIGIETIGCEDERIYYSASIDHLIQECFDVSIIAVACNLGNLQPGSDFDCSENPHRLLFCPGKGSDFIGLKFN